MTSPTEFEAALNDACSLLLDEWGLTTMEIARVAGRLVAQCEDIVQERNEAEWTRQEEALMESGGSDDSSYRRDMKNAGRGHLLR